MRKSLMGHLQDPNDRSTAFRIYAHEVVRGRAPLTDLDDKDVLPEDDVKTGFIVNTSNGNVFPISDFVLSMLDERDADTATFRGLLFEAMRYSPRHYHASIQQTLGRLKRSKGSSASAWSQEEMVYYDRDVATESLRREALENVRREARWNVFLERREHLLRYLRLDANSMVLEIGCGSARTVSWLLPPEVHAYRYVGSDISLKRLVLAKQVMPRGDFVQCSCLAPPFQPATFAAAIAFGVFHHLPAPDAGIRSCVKTLQREGYLLVHEPVEKPQRLLAGKLGFRIRRLLLETYEHSSHDNEIDRNGTMALAADLGLSILHLHDSGSIPRTLASRIVESFGPLSRTKCIWQAIVGLDGIFNRLFCRQPNVLGPNSVFMVLRKGSPEGFSEHRRLSEADFATSLRLG